MLLKETFLDKSIKQAYSKGVQIIGMCGGYQMLGRKIYDPQNVESSHKKINGIGLLNIETSFEKKDNMSGRGGDNSGLRDWGYRIQEKKDMNPESRTLHNPKSKGAMRFIWAKAAAILVCSEINRSSGLNSLKQLEPFRLFTGRLKKRQLLGDLSARHF